MARRLTRDPGRAVLGGVAAGFADHFDLDPVLVRLGFVLLAIANGFGLIAYLVCWVIMPQREREGGEAVPPEPNAGERIVDGVRRAGEKVVDGLRGSNGDERRGGLVAGAILIVIGLVFLVDRLPWLHWPHWARFTGLWPLILVGIGIALIFGARRGKSS